jgi:hypothetical protein
MTSVNDSALRYVRSLEGQQFWGFLTMKFEDGRIVHLRREENLKPSAIENLPEKNRGDYDNRAN